MRYSSLFEQNNGERCIKFWRNDESFLQLNSSEQSFRINKFRKNYIIYLNAYEK